MSDFASRPAAWPPLHLANESLRLQGGIDDYAQYCAAVSAMTEVDMSDLKARILQLVTNPDLRQRMGQAALARVRQLYDWAAVIPQFQALWGEQDQRRVAGAARSQRIPGHLLPVAPSPSLLFRSYPTETATLGAHRYVANDPGQRPDLHEMLALRNYTSLRRIFAGETQIKQVLDAVTAAGAGGVDLAAISAATLLQPMYLDRVVIWLLKYDFIRRLP